MNKFRINILEKDLYYEGEKILKYKIEYPEIVTTEYEEGKIRFNKYNKKESMKLKEYAEDTLYNQAKETYKYNKENGYPIMVYEMNVNCVITYNYNSIISLYSDQYIFSGGAHGNTIRKSQTWDLKIAKILPLKYFYRGNEYYQIEIIRQINEQIANSNENGIYFPDYCELILQTFNLENYYLTEKGIVVFFQQYDIAPYSTGIPIFLVN